MAEETTAAQSGAPLAGRSVVVTRARAQAAQFTEALEALGAEVIVMPVIETIDPEDWAPADAAIAELSTYDWVVVASANAVHRFAARLGTLGIEVRSALEGVAIAAVGTKTAEHVVAVFGYAPDLVPDDFSADGLLAAFTAEGAGEGWRVLIPRAATGREVLREGLSELGVHVDVVATYRTVPAEVAPEVLARLREGVDAVTFTSPSTAKYFLECIERAGIDPVEFMRSTTVGSIGPVTTEALGKRGFDVDTEASPYTVAALADALGERFSAEN